MKYSKELESIKDILHKAEMRVLHIFNDISQKNDCIPLYQDFIEVDNSAEDDLVAFLHETDQLEELPEITITYGKYCKMKDVFVLGLFGRYIEVIERGSEILLKIKWTDIYSLQDFRILTNLLNNCVNGQAGNK